MKYPIKLGGRSYPEVMPSNPSEMYPTLFISGLNADLPDSGEITLKFKKVSETKRNRDGDKSRSVDLEIHEICDVKPAKKEKEEEDSGEALDKLAKEAEEAEEEGDEEGKD